MRLMLSTTSYNSTAASGIRVCTLGIQAKKLNRRGWRSAPMVSLQSIKDFRSDIVTDRLSTIREDEAELYGLNPGHLKMKPEQGGGFPVLFEFHHHLHCLVSDIS